MAMAFTLYSLLQAALLCVNAIAVLHEERFLKNSECRGGGGRLGLGGAPGRGASPRGEPGWACGAWGRRRRSPDSIPPAWCFAQTNPCIFVGVVTDFIEGKLERSFEFRAGSGGAFSVRVFGMTGGEPDGSSRRWWEVGLMVKGVSKDSSHPCSRCTPPLGVYRVPKTVLESRNTNMKTRARVMVSSSSPSYLLARLSSCFLLYRTKQTGLPDVRQLFQYTNCGLGIIETQTHRQERCISYITPEEMNRNMCQASVTEAGCTSHLSLR